jgi:hypothetical protein
MTNSARSNTLLMLADIDTDHRDSDAAAKYFVREYLAGHGFVEPSTGWRGRHVYFKLDIEYSARPVVWERFREYADIVRSDPRFEVFGCRFDKVFYGLPTYWKKDEGGNYELVKRGTLVKLPYVMGADSDINTINSLPILPFSGLEQHLAEQRVHVVATSSASGLVLDTRLGAHAADSWAGCPACIRPQPW